MRLIGYVNHRRGARVVRVPVYYQPVAAKGRYTGAKLRAIWAGGKHR